MKRFFSIAFLLTLFFVSCKKIGEDNIEQPTQQPALISAEKIDEQIRNTIYALLQRNIRWFDIHQILLELILERYRELGPNLTEKLLTCLANSPNTAVGHTLTSYRIPIAWESLFVFLYDILVDTL